MLIAQESPLVPDIARLIDQHLADNYDVSPAESVHAVNASALCDSDITFWSARDDTTAALLGMGALKQHSPSLAELKSMRTSPKTRRRGVARMLLSTIIAECRHRGVVELKLETGVEEFFAPARGLYESLGFVRCGPFASYSVDPNSLYYTLAISRS